MHSVQNQTIPSLVQEDELEAAQKVALAFNNAFKYYSLYPEGHAFSRNYMSRLKKDLDDFLNNYEKLHLDIERSSYFYKGEVVFAGKAEEHNSAYLLSRDRILFLEFTRNIELSEISHLLDIFKRHRNPLENDDSDIATTLWHYRLDHIHYEAADIFAMEAIQFELSMFKVAPGLDHPDGNAENNSGFGQDGFTRHEGISGEVTQEQEAQVQLQRNASHCVNAQYTQGGQEATETPSSAVLLSKDKGLAELDQEEQKKLDLMVKEEEGHDFTSDAVDILLITLSVESNELEFASILNFLEYEFFDALAREDFSLALKICKNVFNLSLVLKAKRPWTFSLINIFFASLGREDRFMEMSWLYDYQRILSIPEKNQILLAILEQLPEDIILVLGMLAAQIPSDNISLRHTFFDILAAKARKSPLPFCKLIEESGEDTILGLLPVIEQLEMKGAAQVYLQMTHHPSSAIRKIGIDGFFQRNRNPAADEIMHILRDPDKFLRERVLSYIEKLENALQEDLLITFLGKESSQVDDGLHILQCYRLLSKCLSPGSIGFLGHTLLESDLKSMFSHMRKAHKSGSAYVLRSLGTKEAMQILRKGADSLRPDVRQICRKALEN